MRIVWWLLGISFVGQVALVLVLGGDRAVGAVRWVNAPLSLFGAAVALERWWRYRQGGLPREPVPLLPLGIFLVLNAIRYFPATLGRVTGPAFVAALWLTSIWFITAYIRSGIRESKSSSSHRAA